MSSKRWALRKRSLDTMPTQAGIPKYNKGDIVGDFVVSQYLGHTAVNYRTNEMMSKAQHWYKCECMFCSNEEFHSQQEMVDPRHTRELTCKSCFGVVVTPHQP